MNLCDVVHMTNGVQLMIVILVMAMKYIYLT